MTSRLAGLAVFAVLAALEVAVRLAGNASDAGEGRSALLFALRAVPLAVAAGVIVAGVAATRRGRRAAAVAALCAYVAVGLWMWSTSSPRTPEEAPARSALELIAAFATAGTALALAAAVVACWVARNAVGRDGAERLLALETTGLHGPRDQWGAAMRAELASIDDPAQRGRFARSAAGFALRRGTGPWPVVLAALASLGAAVVVYCAARASDGRGIVGEPLMSLVLVLLVVAVIAGTLLGGSFRAGLETAILAWLAIYLCSIAVEIPQAIAWYHDEGILLMDGEPAAPHGVDARGAALQPITHSAFIVVALSQLVIAVLAAGLGTLALRAARVIGTPPPRA
jgi:hypothetical protein